RLSTAWDHASQGSDCRPGLYVQKSPLLARSGPKRDRLCLSAFGAKRTSAAALSRPSQPLLTRSVGRGEIPQCSALLLRCHVLSVRSEAREPLGNETARVHRAAGQRCGRLHWPTKGSRDLRFYRRELWMMIVLIWKKDGS